MRRAAMRAALCIQAHHHPSKRVARVVLVLGRSTTSMVSKILREAQKLGDSFSSACTRTRRHHPPKRAASHSVLPGPTSGAVHLHHRVDTPTRSFSRARDLTNDLLTTFNVSVVVAEDENDPYEISGEDATHWLISNIEVCDVAPRASRSGRSSPRASWRTARRSRRETRVKRRASRRITQFKTHVKES